MSSDGGTRAPSERDEVEVKIPWPDLDTLRQKLREAGGTLRTALHEESNVLYDDSAGNLAKSGCVLRLRRADEKTILTFKGRARFEGGLKRRPESETMVSDAAATEAILEGLGFRRRFRYEKEREEWTLPGCVIALDHTPIGNFVEVEGDPSEIRRAVVALGLDFASAIPYSYARLYMERRRENPSLPEDMVFDPKAAR